jgi:hypothetical protein
MEKLDPRVRQVLVELRDNPGIIVDGEFGTCNVCFADFLHGRAHGIPTFHDEQCIATIAKKVLEEEEFDKLTEGF